VSTRGPRRPNVTDIEKEGEGATDAQLAPGRGNTEARQQKARREIQL
jgi:hypothetical protein